MNNWHRCILGMIFTLLTTSCHTPQQNTPTASPTQSAPEQPTVEAEPAYALHQPSMEEYLSAIPTIVTRIENQHTYDDDIYQLRTAITNDLWMLYGDQLGTASYDQLIEVDPYLFIIPGYYARRHYMELDETDWHTLVVNAWLRDIQTDLETNSQWTFDNYTLNLEAADFNGDGINEFSAELVQKDNESFEYREVFLVQRDANLAEGYSRLIDTSLVHNGKVDNQPAPVWNVYSIEDVTGDGLPEWLVNSSGCDAHACIFRLGVYGWHNGAMQQFTLDRGENPSQMLPTNRSSEGTIIIPSAPPPGTWAFENLDDDPPLELVQKENFSRRCEFTKTTVYDWDDNMRLVSTGETYDYADSPWCALRQAHIAMYDHDFSAAITHYERVLSVEPTDEVEIEAWQYARLRLATAYALDGQISQAASILSQLENETPTSSIMEEMIDNAVSAFAEKQNPLQLCTALSSAITGYSVWKADDTHILTYGQINDFLRPINSVGGDYGPYRTGCDIGGLWRDTVESLSDDSPLNMREQIEAQGWSIGGELQADLNQDGVDELILWTDYPPVGSVIRISDQSKGYYTILSNPFEPGSSASFTVVDLPEVSTPVLVEIFNNPSITCEMDTWEVPGWILVWRINGTESEVLAQHNICAPQTIEETFTIPGELQILSSWNSALEVLYWDATTERFLTQFELKIKQEAAAEDSDPLGCQGSIYDLCFSYEQPAEALQVIDTVRAEPPKDITPEFFFAMHYLRASMLELLGDEEAALAEYIQIYEAAPDSAWGMLGQLHLDISEP